MELGSEFSIDVCDISRKDNNIYEYLDQYNLMLLDSGRSCLKLLSNTLEKGDVLLPEYICESVINAFTGRNIVYYKILPNLEIDFFDLSQKLNGNIKILFLMHYFGKMQPNNILNKIQKLKENLSITVIEDTTHSIFSNPHTIGDYCICSIRKWFALPDGGLLYSQNKTPISRHKKLQKNTDIGKIYPFILKQLFLEGVINEKETYRNLFVKFENRFDTRTSIMSISDISRFMLECYDVNKLKRQRKSNYIYLQDKLSSLGITPLNSISNRECPFVFPIMIPNRDNFRQYLIQHNIYCAIHWPMDNSSCISPVATDINNKIISLPIDQRYSENELDYLYKIIAGYFQVNDGA